MTTIYGSIDQKHEAAGNVTGSIQGTGVGLASAAHVITLHGGTISVSSTEGQGSTFVVRLPVT